MSKSTILSLANLTDGFKSAQGTHVVAIAGILESAVFSTRNDSKDVLEAFAKMYAGVNGQLKNGDVTVMETPKNWVYRLYDSEGKIQDPTIHRTLTQVTSDNTPAAKEMYKNIYDLASTDYKTNKTKSYFKLGDKISRGTLAAGKRFQLLFRYNHPNGLSSEVAAINLEKAKLELRQANFPDEKDLIVPIGAGAGADAVNTAKANVATAEANVATAKANLDATQINGTGYIRYGDTDTDIKSFSVKNNKIYSAFSSGLMKVMQLLNNLIGADTIVYSKAVGAGDDYATVKDTEDTKTRRGALSSASLGAAEGEGEGNENGAGNGNGAGNENGAGNGNGAGNENGAGNGNGAGNENGAGAEAEAEAYKEKEGREIGGKSSVKKRRTSFKKGGRNNSASRKQNKKGGAKARRSQKGGKRMR